MLQSKISLIRKEETCKDKMYCVLKLIRITSGKEREQFANCLFLTFHVQREVMPHKPTGVL